MYLTKPIKLEELKQRGSEPECFDYLVEWAVAQLKIDLEGIKAAQAIIEGRTDSLDPAELAAGTERIEEWEREEMRSEAAD